MLRVWWEDDSDHPLRVRISRTVGNRQTMTASASIEEVFAIVEWWVLEAVNARRSSEVQHGDPVEGSATESRAVQRARLL